ncbi:hypothetical protein SDC9_117903 [bioreactor metagenome]|uniref:Uncharacterized protein n=1 Tax=bioreactor metagenome TaxID=1076179 RepID=A0A645C1X1_9ZZZZ
MTIDDAIADRQAQSGPLPHRLGGEKGFEQAVQVLFRNARTVVDEVQDRHPLLNAAANLQARLRLSGSGVAGVLDEVHDHLLQLAGRTGTHQFGRQVDIDGELGRGALHHPAHGTLDHVVEIDPFGCRLVHRREAFQGIDDIARALCPFDHAVDQVRHVGEDAVDTQLLAHRPQGTILGGIAAMHRSQVAFQAAGVTLERQHVAEYETDRIVQFVRDAGHQAPQRDHFFGMQQLALRALQIVVRLTQRGIRPAQLADRAAGDHHAHQLAGLRHARSAVHRDRDGRPVAGAQEEFAVMHPFPGITREHVARLGLLAVIGKEIEERRMDQFLGRLA